MSHAEFDFDIALHPGSIKAAMKTIGAASRDLWQVPPESIHVIDGFNVRVESAEHAAHIRNLADSMRSEGYYQDKPLAGYVSKENGADIIYIYDGHCRLAAVNLANNEGADIPVVPVSVSQAGLSMDDMIVSMVRSNSGKQLTPYETGLVCKRLVRAGHKVVDVATRLGLTKPYVDSLLELVAAPAELRNMVVGGKVSATVAIETLHKYGEKAVEKLQKAQERAGIKKVTAKHVEQPKTLQSEVSARAADMYNILRAVYVDDGFNRLSSSGQQKVRDIMQHFSSIEQPSSEPLAGRGCQQLEQGSELKQGSELDMAVNAQ